MKSFPLHFSNVRNPGASKNESTPTCFKSKRVGVWEFHQLPKVVLNPKRMKSKRQVHFVTRDNKLQRPQLDLERDPHQKCQSKLTYVKRETNTDYKRGQHLPKCSTSLHFRLHKMLSIHILVIHNHVSIYMLTINVSIMWLYNETTLSRIILLDLAPIRVNMWCTTCDRAPSKSGVGNHSSKKSVQFRLTYLNDILMA